MKSTQTLTKIVLDPFCFKQFEKAAGSQFISVPKEEFTAKINEFYLAQKDNGALKDGYAPFCKHLFIPNFTDCVSGCVEITEENK